MIRWSRKRGFTQLHIAGLLALLGAGLVMGSRVAPRWMQREANVADAAQNYLRARNIQPLAADLDGVLGEVRGKSIPTLSHPLLSNAVPDFDLVDHAGNAHSLSEHLSRGPVVVVFYYGYYCNHCVSQLFALNADIAHFRKLGAEVLAISADSPEETAEKFAKYGMFEFPVLSDPDNKIAAAYSIVAPSKGGASESLLHGTFVIDQQGVLRWCHYGEAPFESNGTLLVELAQLQGRQLP